MPNRSSEPNRRFGAHMSVAGGLHRAFEAGVAAGCDCLQIFVKNQRQWRAAPLSDTAIREFQQAQSATGLAPVVAHASYLINLASPSDSLRKRSADALRDELERCEALRVSHLVFHPGAYLDSTPSEGMQRIADEINGIHRRCAGFTSGLLLEVTAGQGTTLGRTFAELAEIIEKTEESARVGVCLDTCHLLAAGYDITSQEGYDAMIGELDRTVGLERVRCIHMNDSKNPLGSRLDRHEHIGKGCIGSAGFRRIVSDERWRDLPMILETPKGTNPAGRDWDRVNLAALRRLCHPVAPRVRRSRS